MALTDIAKKYKNSCSSEELTIRNLQWDLASEFIGEPLNNRTMARLSHFVDQRLFEYASIMGSTPVVRSLRGCCTEAPIHIEGVGLDYQDEHVCHDGERGEDGFVRIPPQETRDSRPDQDQAVTAALTESQRFIRERRTPTPALVMNSSTLHWRRSEDGENVGHTQIIPSENVSTRQIIPPENVITAVVESQRVRRFREGDTESVSTQFVNPITPQRFIPEPIEANGDSVEAVSGFINPTTGETGRLVDRVRRERPYVDEPVYTSGLTYEVQNRVRDTIARYPQTLDSPSTRIENRYHRDNPSENGIQAHRLGIPSTNQRHLRLRQDNHNDSYFASDFRAAKDTLTYVTSYDINYTLGTVEAKVLIAPHDRVISHEEWFGFNCPSSMKEAIHQAIRANLTIKTNAHHSSIPYSNEPLPERIALDTLREMISEIDFRRYLKKGYVLAFGKSGRIYQVYRTGHTRVYENGKMIEELCMSIRNAPPTDSVIAKLIMIDSNEDDLKTASNIYRMVA